MPLGPNAPSRNSETSPNSSIGLLKRASAIRSAATSAGNEASATIGTSWATRENFTTRSSVLPGPGFGCTR